MGHEYVKDLDANFKRNPQKLFRVMDAKKRYAATKQLAISKSKFRTYAQAKKAVIELQDAIAERNAFDSSIGGLKTLGSVIELLNNPELSKKHTSLVKKEQAAQSNVRLAKLVFPKLIEKKK